MELWMSFVVWNKDEKPIILLDVLGSLKGDWHISSFNVRLFRFACTSRSQGWAIVICSRSRSLDVYSRFDATELFVCCSLKIMISIDRVIFPFWWPFGSKEDFQREWWELRSHQTCCLLVEVMLKHLELTIWPSTLSFQMSDFKIQPHPATSEWQLAAFDGDGVAFRGWK